MLHFNLQIAKVAASQYFYLMAGRRAQGVRVQEAGMQRAKGAVLFDLVGCCAQRLCHQLPAEYVAGEVGLAACSLVQPLVLAQLNQLGEALGWLHASSREDKRDARHLG